jgi:hypothetical protein
MQKCGWKEVRSIPAQKTWHPAKDKLAGTEAYGSAYSSTEPWSVKFDNIKFDQFMFTSGDYTKWVVAHKDSVIGWYNKQSRPILRSSSNSKPYKAIWYRRTGNPEDPWVSIGNYNSGVVHGSASTTSNNAIPLANGGAKVFIRDSTGNDDKICLGPDTVEAKTGCQWTPPGASKIQDACYCKDNAFVLDRLGAQSL